MTDGDRSDRLVDLLRERAPRVSGADAPAELMRRHVEALFIMDSAGRLVAVNEAGGAPAPRFFLGLTSAGPQCWFRHDIDEELIERLTGVAATVEPAHPWETMAEAGERFGELLEVEAPVGKVWSGPAFSFPDTSFPEPPPADERAVVITPEDAALLSPHFDGWLDDLDAEVPFAAVIQGGRAVSICCSVRISAEAHEAGVETHPAHRGRGHAVRAVAAWARAVHDLGRAPLYSTSWTNEASRSVARKLGLVHFGSDLHLT